MKVIRDNTEYEIGINHMRDHKTTEARPQMKKVVFNDPATVIYWTDGTKTLVKCQPGDRFDPLLGFLLAVFKKSAGNKSNYNNALRRIVPGYGKDDAE